MTPEHTPATRTSQRDWVRLSLLREDSRADRRDMPRRKAPVVVVVPASVPAAIPAAATHVFVIPVITENGRLL